MGGGLLQLVAYGAQDVYLTGNPQITFFKVVYRRHTNFSMEAIQQTFSGIPAYGNTVYCQISRNGDLIHRAYLQVTLPALTNVNSKYVNYVGLRLLKSISIEIGGQQIDKHYSDWLYIWNELSLPIGKRSAWELMVGADNDITTPVANTLYIPLEFWFCRNIGLALPLIALQYHEVKIKIEFESINNCLYQVSLGNTVAADAADTSSTRLDANLWVDYIFLDTDERRKFAQLSHEYLIEQLQFTGAESLTANTATRVKLNFNHPCKELIWVAKYNSSSTVNQWYNYTIKDTNAFNTASDSIGGTQGIVINSVHKLSPSVDVTDTNIRKAIVYNVEPGFISNAKNPFTRCLLQLNGNDRFAERDGSYFNYVQPYQHHTNIPANKGINVYSFSLKPEEHQPSGTLNMSRIDTAVLAVTNGASVSGLIHVYATNYNVLRILSGMGGLAYSN
jgi:Major capsid protein N-terminus/Large eukaryotic DNA virus major capsid protein